MDASLSRLSVVLLLAGACAAPGSERGGPAAAAPGAVPEGPATAAPEWTVGCKASTAHAGDRRLLRGVACVDDPALTSPVLRARLAQTRARAEAAALDDSLVAAIMDGYATSTLAAEMRKVSQLVEESGALTSCAETWADAGRACCLVEIDLQRDLVGRLDGDAIGQPLADHVRERAASAFDALGVECPGS